MTHTSQVRITSGISKRLTTLSTPNSAKPELAEIKWDELNQRQLHNFIRGNDSVPGLTLKRRPIASAIAQS